MLLFTLLLFSIINIILGFLVLLRNKQSVVNITYFLFIICGTSWLFSNYIADHASNNSLNLLFSKMTMVFALLVIFCFYMFSTLFIETSKKVKTVTNVFSIMTAIVCMLSFFTAYIVESTVIESGVTQVTFGSLGVLYFILVILLLGTGSVVLFTKFRAANGINKKRLYFVSLGLILTAIIAVFTNLVLPMIFQNFALTPYGIYSSIIFTSFTAYAIVKHRLMDIRLVIVRSLSFSLLMLILIGGFVFPLYEMQLWIAANNLSFLKMILINVSAIVVIGLMIPIIRKLLTKITDRIFFKGEYDPEVFQKDINRILSSNIILSEILYKTLDYMIKEFRLEKGLFVISEGGQIRCTQSIGYKKVTNPDYDDVVRLKRLSLLIADELEDKNKLKKLLRKYEAAVSIKLFDEHHFAGVLILGENKSGEMYSQKDISMLEIIVPEITMAIQRAKQYEEIQEFNKTLRVEVLRATRKLKEANEHLKELDEAKDEFISMASHQLRTPLTAIRGYLSMLLEGDVGEIMVGQFDFINEAFISSNKMVGLINDLLSVSRMSTGKFMIDISEVEIKPVIEDEIRQYAQNARAKGLFLKLECSKGLPVIKADEKKIQQAIMNFIDNAIYYTETGGIVVRASANKHDFVFEVHDTGIGVPKEIQSTIFTKFIRADNAKKLRPDGSGLGLYLAKRIIEDHHGEIIFKTSSKGSVFGFRLPIKARVKADLEKKALIA